MRNHAEKDISQWNADSPNRNGHYSQDFNELDGRNSVSLGRNPTNNMTARRLNFVNR